MPTDTEQDKIKRQITESQDGLVVAIGKRVKMMRAAHGLTQQALADKLGLSRAAVAQWESGQATCSFAQALAMEALFGIDVGFILFGRKYAVVEPASEMPIDA